MADVLPSWLDRLEPNGRLLVPLTVTSDGHASVGFGQMLLVTRDRDAHRARLLVAHRDACIRV